MAVDRAEMISRVQAKISYHPPAYPSLLKADLKKILRCVTQGWLQQEVEQRLKTQPHQPVNMMFPSPDLFKLH